MQTIIVPLDGSEMSERAVGYGKRLARIFGATLQLLHVIEQSPLELLRRSHDEDHAAAQRYLQEVQSRISDSVLVETVVVSGDATEQILLASTQRDDLAIVISTHGRGGLGRVMHGSVADKVLRNATAPVTLVRSSLPPPPSIRALLVPLDGSKFSEAAVPTAVDIAKRTRALLVLVRVIEPYWQDSFAMGNALSPEFSYLDPSKITELEEEALKLARTYLAQMAGRLRGEGLRLTWEVRTGRAANEIARLAETFPADMAIMATNGFGGIRRWALGSVTNETIHRGTLPVMVVPPRLVEQAVNRSTATATV